MKKRSRSLKTRSAVTSATLVAAVLGTAGLYADYTPLIVAAMVTALASVIGWIWMTTPHNHWADLPKRRPSER